VRSFLLSWPSRGPRGAGPRAFRPRSVPACWRRMAVANRSGRSPTDSRRTAFRRLAAAGVGGRRPCAQRLEALRVGRGPNRRQPFCWPDAARRAARAATLIVVEPSVPLISAATRRRCIRPALDLARAHGRSRCSTGRSSTYESRDAAVVRCLCSSRADAPHTPSTRDALSLVSPLLACPRPRREGTRR
jgi:hypothetical protein